MSESGDVHCTCRHGCISSCLEIKHTTCTLPFSTLPDHHRSFVALTVFFFSLKTGSKTQNLVKDRCKSAIKVNVRNSIVFSRLNDVTCSLDVMCVIVTYCTLNVQSLVKIAS